LKHFVKKTIHWANLIVIITNGIKFIQDCKVPNYSFMPNISRSSLTYCYQSVIGINLSLSQSEPIKWILLYLQRANNNLVRKLFSQ
jgi:hypothetical protein